MKKENSLHPAIKGQRSTIIGIIGSFVLVVAKGLAGYFGNSYALIADATESASDIFSSLVLLFALRISIKAPDEDHPYGHGKAEPLAAMAVSLALIGAAILIAVQSIHNLQTPHETPLPFTLIVLAFSVFIKEYLFRYVIKVSQEVGSHAVKADAWHHRSDAITSATAFIGITISLIGGKGYEYADDWAALCASVIIVINAYNLFLPALNEIMDAAPSSELAESIKTIAFNVEGVKDLHKLKVRKTGFEFFVDMHIMVDRDLTVAEGHQISHNVKDKILESNPRIYDVLIHVEPM